MLACGFFLSSWWTCSQRRTVLCSSMTQCSGAAITCSGSDRAHSHRWPTEERVFSYVTVKRKSRETKEDKTSERRTCLYSIIHPIQSPNLDLFAVAMLIWGKRNLVNILAGCPRVQPRPSHVESVLTCSNTISLTAELNYELVKLVRAFFSLCPLYCHWNCFLQLRIALSNWFPRFHDTKITLLRMIGTSQSESICVRTQQSSSASDTCSVHMQDFFCWGEQG